MNMSSLTPSLSTPASPLSKKRRRAITNADKIEIRQYFFDPTHTKRPTLKAVQAWYKDKHPHCRIAFSTLSEITSSKYEILDKQVPSLTHTRLRESAYPDLEAALYQFQLQITRKGATMTGQIL
jgi:Fission yeast centromere protein N-terminal domain